MECLKVQSSRITPPVRPTAGETLPAIEWGDYPVRRDAHARPRSQVGAGQRANTSSRWGGWCLGCVEVGEILTPPRRRRISFHDNEVGTVDRRPDTCPNHDCNTRTLLICCILSTSHFWDGSPKAQSLFFPTPFSTGHSSEKSVLLQSLWRCSDAKSQTRAALVPDVVSMPDASLPASATHR